jgi:hypothetical protein
MKEAIQSLTSEAKTSAQEQRKNDLPSTNLSVIVHIFIDVGRLADDLASAGLLPEPDKLWTFIQGVCAEAGVTISDVGSDQRAVAAKMKCKLSRAYGYISADCRDFYELYLENCHNRHLFLALGGDSAYYQTLESCEDDAYTKMKTSLVHPIAADSQLPFHTIAFSSLEKVPQQSSASVELTTPMPALTASIRSFEHGWVHNGVPQPSVSSPTQFITIKSSCPARQPASPQKSTVQGSPRPTTTPITRLKSTSSPSPAAKAEQAIPAERVSPTLAVLTPSSHLSGIPQNFSNANGHHHESSSLAGVVKLDASPQHSSHNFKATESSWESKTTNSYLPNPIDGGWGQDTSIAMPSTDEVTVPSGHNGRRSARQARIHNINTNQRSQAKQFHGAWDDLMELEQLTSSGSSASPRPSLSVSSSSTTKTKTDFTSVFAEQVAPKAEPNASTRPVSAPIALNKAYQRIDLAIPKPTHENEQAFKKRIANRHLCNEHHMRGVCNDTQCTYDHEEISDGLYLTLRHVARRSPCHQGSACRRHDCYHAHHCKFPLSETWHD